MSLITSKKDKDVEIGRLKANKTDYHLMADLTLYKPLPPLHACKPHTAYNWVIII